MNEIILEKSAVEIIRDLVMQVRRSICFEFRKNRFEFILLCSFAASRHDIIDMSWAID